MTGKIKILKNIFCVCESSRGWINEIESAEQSWWKREAPEVGFHSHRDVTEYIFFNPFPLLCFSVF